MSEGLYYLLEVPSKSLTRDFSFINANFMKNKTLFIAATHGDEPIGVEVLEDLQAFGFSVDHIIGNPKALFERKRFIDADLNRSAPGNLNSDVLEERRAAEIIDLSKQYPYTIDLHGSNNENGIFIIITNPIKESFKLASMLDIERIVIWPSIAKEQKGALSEYFKCGLEIECGRKDDPKIKDELIKVLKSYINNKEKTDENWYKKLKQRRIYKMYGSLKRSECNEEACLKEFIETEVNGES